MSEEATKETKKTGRTLAGIVISDKMDKTITVQVSTKESHDEYGKIMNRRNKFKAHDEKNEAKKGDWVRIRESRPISKEKRWTLINVQKGNDLNSEDKAKG